MVHCMEMNFYKSESESGEKSLSYFEVNATSWKGCLPVLLLYLCLQYTGNHWQQLCIFTLKRTHILRNYTTPKVYRGEEDKNMAEPSLWQVDCTTLNTPLSINRAIV